MTVRDLVTEHMAHENRMDAGWAQLEQAIDQLGAKAKRLKGQRDELLAALNGALADLQDNNVPLKCALSRIETTIAKIEQEGR